MSSEAEHVHHPNADHSVEFKGFAAYEKKGPVKPFAYNPQKLADDFVEIQISHCGICGSDLHMIDSGWRPAPYPIIVGHEIIGTVTAAGSEVKNVKVGDRVGVGAQCGSCLNRGNDCEECGTGWEQACRRNPSYTYASRRPDGQITQGGYADRIRLQSDFAFKIPESISSAEAAPLMCGGVTVFAPLQRHVTKPGMKVAVIGIGGLGHMGVKFAAKLLDGSCEVTAISSSSKKKEEALKLGAHKFLDTSDKEDIKKHFRYFDFVLCTANGNNMAITEWLSMIRMGGTFCTVGAPEEPLSISVWPLLSQVKVTGSGIGSIKEINEMLAFADKHNVRPQIEVLPMDKANEGIQKVRDNTVRFRVVLENPK